VYITPDFLHWGLNIPPTDPPPKEVCVDFKGNWHLVRVGGLVDSLPTDRGYVYEAFLSEDSYRQLLERGRDTHLAYQRVAI
jgi:hypothetical protein